MNVLYMNFLSMPFMQVASDVLKLLRLLFLTYNPTFLNIKITIFQVFVTHGGLLSTMEAIHSQTVVVGIPFANDQENTCCYLILKIALKNTCVSHMTNVKDKSLKSMIA
jgi:hypothetical protein